MMANRLRASMGRYESEFGRSKAMLENSLIHCQKSIKTLCHNKKQTHRGNLPSYEQDIQEWEHLQAGIEIALSSFSLSENPPALFQGDKVIVFTDAYRMDTYEGIVDRIQWSMVHMCPVFTTNLVSHVWDIAKCLKEVWRKDITGQWVKVWG